MNIEEFETLMLDETKFRKTLKSIMNGENIEGLNLIKNQFNTPRVSFSHQFITPNGSKLDLKFFDVIKTLRNSKNLELFGKESWLSYLEVSIYLPKVKATSYTTDILQCVWAKGKSIATKNHQENLTKLKEQANRLGINLDSENSWVRVYTENY